VEGEEVGATADEARDRVEVFNGEAVCDGDSGWFAVSRQGGELGEVHIARHVGRSIVSRPRGTWDLDRGSRTDDRKVAMLLGFGLRSQVTTQKSIGGESSFAWQR
jgi:hypothetical protein